MQKNDSKKKYTILMLISDTGGGHRASANALAAAVEYELPQACDVMIIDIWSRYGVWPFNTFVPAYKFLCDNPTYWKMLYDYTKFQVSREVINASGYALCSKRFKKEFENLKPDLVCSVHPMCQNLPLAVLDELASSCHATQKRRVPFATVVTDLGGAHPTWFDPKVDLCFVGSSAVKRIALEEGLTEEQIRYYGLPLRQPFWTAETRTKEAVRFSLGLHPYQPTCLIVGGGQGIGQISQLTRDILQSLSLEKTGCFQIVVVCGNNENLKTELQGKFQNYTSNYSKNFNLTEHEQKKLEIDSKDLLPVDQSSFTQSSKIQKELFRKNSCTVNTQSEKASDPTAPRQASSFSVSFKRSQLSSPKEGTQMIKSYSEPLLGTKKLNRPLSESLSFIDPQLMKLQRNRNTVFVKRSLRCAPFNQDAFRKTLEHSLRRKCSSQRISLPHLLKSWWAENIITRQSEPTRSDVHVKQTDLKDICKNVTLYILGFISNIHDWMAASDLIVTKAGPGTIAEACTRTLPVLIYTYLPGQEEGNVDFVVNGRFGGYSSSTKYIASMTRQLLTNQTQAAKLSERSGKAVDPNATRKIAQDIINLMLKSKKDS